MRIYNEHNATLSSKARKITAPKGGRINTQSILVMFLCCIVTDYENTVLNVFMAFNRELSFESPLLKPHKEKWQITILFSLFENKR